VNWLIPAREWLEAINPAAPWLALTLTSWLACIVIRKRCPTLWSALLAWGPPNGALEKILGSLPSVVASTVVAAIGTGGDPWGAALGAVMGALAPVLHHAVKASPLPYRGDLGNLLDGPTSRRIVADALRDELDKL
jgi:hypothetical protein